MNYLESIITDITNSLKTITTTNGYQTNFPTTIYKWRTSVIGDNETIVVNVKDKEIQDNYASDGYDMTLLFEIVITLNQGADNNTNLTKMITDVRKLFYNVENTYANKYAGAGWFWFRLGTTTKNIELQDKEIAEAVIEVQAVRGSEKYFIDSTNY